MSFALHLLLAAAAVTPAAHDAHDAPMKALRECVVMKSTGADRLAAARWMVMALASAPQMTGLVSVTPAARPDQDRAVAALFTRLLTVDCLKETQAFSRADRPLAFRAAGEMLGQIAVMEVLNNREAAAALETFSQYIKPEDFKKLEK